jgi:hypothetical protein
MLDVVPILMRCADLSTAAGMAMARILASGNIAC